MSEPWVITIALIAVALICYIVSSCLHKEENTISYILIAAGVTLILSGVPTFEELLLGIVANLLNFKLVAAEGEYWVRIIAGLALIVLGIALVFKIKKRIYVLNMYGIAAKKNIDDPKSAKDLKLAEYKIKEQVVNFTPFFEGNAMTQKMNNSICEQINEETKRFSAKASEQKESCFTGMAPIPYTVYAGTLLEEAKILGKNILITDTAAREAVENYGQAVVIPNDEENIYQTLKEVIKKGKINQNNIQQNYDNKKIIEKVEKLLEE